MSQRFRVLSCAALLGLVVATAAGPVAAQNQPDRKNQPDLQKARNHYAKAEQAMKQGEFTVAAGEYGKAYEITKDPILFYKIAGAHYEAGNCDQAVANYTRYLDQGKPAEALRARTQERIDDCNARTKPGDHAAAGQQGGANPAGGTDAQAGSNQATDAQAGDNQAGGNQAGGDQTAGASSDSAATDTGDAASGQAEGAAGLPGSDRPPSFATQEVSWRSQAAWVSVGLVATFVTAGAVLGLSASSREEDIENLINFRYPNGEPAVYAGTSRDRYEDYVEEGERLAGYSKLAFGAAGLAAVSATVFFIMDARSGKERAPTSAEIAPMATPSTLGMAAGWRF